MEKEKKNIIETKIIIKFKFNISLSFNYLKIKKIN